MIDPLAMPVGADTTLVKTTLQTIELIHDEFGLNMTLGASNVSFGMPGRPALGAAFLPMAMQCGLTSAIMDVRSPQIVEAVKAADLLLGNDDWGAAWIARFRARSLRLPPRRRRERVTASPGADSAGSSWAGPGAHPLRPGRGPTDATCGCPPGPRCSTRPAGTASPSTPPAAGTARAASAGCGWSRATWRCRGWIRARSARTSCAPAGGWPVGPGPSRTCGWRCRRWSPGRRRPPSGSVGR